MKPKPLLCLILLFGLFLLSPSLLAQKKISLDIENDLPFSDRSYTFGHILSYQKKVDNEFKFLWIQPAHVKFSIQQQLYTPRFISSSNSRFFDRPFASYLGANVRLSSFDEKSLLQTSFSLGAAGPITGGHEIQEWYHINFLPNAAIPSNTDVISNSLHLNSYVSYSRDIASSDEDLPFFITGRGTLALGTRDIFSQIGLGISFGNRLGLAESLLFDEISWEKEFFFFGNVNYRYVFYDAMLEGNLLGDSSQFTIESTSNLLFAEAGVGIRTGKLELRLSHHYNSKRTSLEYDHRYNSLQLAYLFK